MNQNAPSSSPRKQEVFNAAEHADMLRADLGIDEKHKGVWEEDVMKKFSGTLPLPEDSAEGKAVKDELEIRLSDLQKSHTLLLGAFALVYRASSARKEALNTDKPPTFTLSADDLDNIKRHLADFINERYVYEKMWSGDTPSGQTVPEYLAQFLESRGNDKFAMRIAKKILPFQYDVLDEAGISTSPGELSLISEGILLGATSRQLKFKHVMACLDGDKLKSGDKVFKDFLLLTGCEKENLDTAHLEAAKMLVGYLKKNIRSIRDLANIEQTTTKGDVNDLTIAQAMEASVNTAFLSQISSEIADATRGFNWLGGELPDISTIVGKMLDSPEMFSDAAVQAMLSPLAKAGGLDLESMSEDEANAFKEDASEVAKFFMKPEAKIVTVGGVLGSNDQIDFLPPHRQEIVKALLTEATSQTVVDELLRSIFIKPEENHGGIEKEVVDTMTDLVANKKITAHEAFKIQFLRENGSTIPLAYLVVSILKKHGKSRLAIDSQHRVFSSYAGLALQSSTDLDIVAEELGLSPDQKREMSNTSRYLQENGVDFVTGASDQYWSWWRHYPKIMIGIHGGVAGPTIVRQYFKRYNKVRWGDVVNFSELADSDLTKHLTKQLGSSPSPAALNRARALQKEIQTVVIKMNSRNLKNFIMRWPPQPIKALRYPAKIRNQGNALIRSANTGELDKIAIALKEVYPNASDVARSMKEMGTEQYVKKALLKAGFTTSQVDDAVRVLAKEGITIGGPVGSEALSSAARTQERLQRFVSNVSNNKLLDQLARNPTSNRLRMKAARRILGKRFLLPSVKRAILAAHKLPVTDLAGKRAILTNVFKNSDDISLLMRAGICGDVDTALAKLRTAPAAGGVGDDVLRGFAEVGDEGIDALRIMKPGGSLGALDPAQKALVNRWWKSPALGKILKYGGMALQGYIVVTDLIVLEEADKHHELAQKMAKQHLDDLVAKKLFTKEGDTYKYKDKVSIRLDQIGSNTAKTAANWRLVVDAAALASMARVAATGAKVFSGPAGWLIIGAEITIHVGISAWEYSEYYEFIQNADPSLVAYLGGTQATVGKTEFDLIESKFVDMIIQNKSPEARKRILYSWYMTFLQQHSSKAYNEIVGAKPYEGMREFFDEDFTKHILPFARTNLLMQSKTANNSIERIAEFDVTDIVFNTMSKEDVERSFNLATVWYISHIREEKYLDTLALIENTDDPQLKAMLESQAYEFGSAYVLNHRLLEDKEDLLKNKGLTRMELMATAMQKRLSSFEGDATWMDVMKGNSKAHRENGDEFTQKVPKTTEGLPIDVRSYDRDFTFSIEGIYGVKRSKEHKGRAWYSAMPDRTYTPDVPKVSDAVPKLDPFKVPQPPKTFVGLHSTHKDLESIRSDLVSREHRLLSMRSLMGQMSEVDGWRGRHEAANKEMRDLETEDWGIIQEKDKRFDYYNQLHEVRRIEIRKRQEKISPQINVTYDNMKAQEKVLEDIRKKTAAYSYDFAENEEITTPELAMQYASEYSSYILDLEAAEQFTQIYTAEHAVRTAITTSAASTVSEFNITTASTDEALTAFLYSDIENPAPVQYSGEDINERSTIEVSHLALLAQYPYLDTSMNQYQVNHPSHLVSTFIHKSVSKNGDIEYAATYAYSRVQNDTKPEVEDMYYVQIGGKAEGGSGYLELGLPVQIQDKKVYFQASLDALRDNQQDATQEILRNIPRSERLFRAGDIMNDLVQVSRTEWAVRFHEKGKHVFYLIKVNPDGSVQSKKLEYAHTEESIQENARRYLSRDEAYKKTGSMETRKYTEQEQGFGKQIERDLEKQEWGAVPADLVTKFKLDTGDPSQFTNAIPLPFEVAAPAMQFGGVDGIVDKLALRAAAPGQPGLDEGTIARVKGVIEMMNSKLDLQLGAESGAYQGAFELAFDQLMSVQSQEISTAPPDRQREMIKNIMLEAARRVDQQMPQGGTAAQQSLIDATESADFGGY